MQQYLKLILGAALSPIAILAATSAQAGSLNFSVSPFTGSDAKVDVWLTDLDNGSVQFDFKVDKTVNIADLRGIFFDVNDSSLVSNLDITANANPFSDIDNDNFYSIGSNDIFTSRSGNLIKADKAALNGGVDSSQYPNATAPSDGFNVALEIGSQGLKGGRDDFQATSFIVKHLTDTLSVENFANQEFGVRMQSVGANRQGSTKMFASSPSVPIPIPTPQPTPQPTEIPEPSTVLGLTLVGATFKRFRYRQAS